MKFSPGTVPKWPSSRGLTWSWREWLAQQRVGEQIDLADGKVIGGAPPRIHGGQFGGGQRAGGIDARGDGHRSQSWGGAPNEPHCSTAGSRTEIISRRGFYAGGVLTRGRFQCQIAGVTVRPADRLAETRTDKGRCRWADSGVGVMFCWRFRWPPGRSDGPCPRLRPMCRRRWK